MTTLTTTSVPDDLVALGSDAINDLLVQLGVNPNDVGDNPVGGSVADVLARAAIRAALTPTLERLSAAENVCVLLGWPANDLSDAVAPVKATYALWDSWANHPGVSPDPADHPHLSDAVIARLADRDEARQAALAGTQEAHA